MSLAKQLATATGEYFGSGDGQESGPFVSRIVVRLLPNGGVSIDYEATSVEQGLLHQEHSLLVGGPEGKDRLYIAHAESQFVSEFVADTVGSNRFVQPMPLESYTMEVVIEIPEPNRITYAWWWAAAGEPPVEQSKADARRS